MGEIGPFRIRAGRVVCPAGGIDAAAVVSVRGQRIVVVRDEQTRRADANVTNDEASPHAPDLEFPDAILLPGLIDLHAHPARSGSQFGIDPDHHCLPHGTTTVLSQGDAGADNCKAFVRETIEGSRTRVRLAINLAAAGETGPGGCFEQLEHADVAKCVAAIERFRVHIWGIAVNCSRICCVQADPRDVLRRGLHVAHDTGLPLLYGMRQPDDWPLREQLRQLRPGDVVTYCFRRTPHCIVENGRVLPEVREARQRGILFDLGHGRSSFDFGVAEAAIGDGFPPDTISTDLQRGHIGQTPVHTLPLVMSKLRAAGMRESDVFAAVTTRPAQILGLADEIGSLKIGACADLTLLEASPTETLVFDVNGQSRRTHCWRSLATTRSGELIAAVE